MLRGNKKAPFVIEKRESLEDDRLNMLWQEYQAATSRQDKAEDRMVQVLGAGGALLGAVMVFLSQYSRPIPLFLVWFAPLFFILLFILIIYILVNVMLSLWEGRVISHRINYKVEDLSLIRFESEAPSSTFLSMTKGNPKMRLYSLLLFAICAALFSGLMFQCYSVIYAISHWQGTLFIIIYSTLAVIELAILIAVLFDLPSLFQDFIKAISDKAISDLVADPKTIAPNFTFRSDRHPIGAVPMFFAWLLPRPVNFLFNGLITFVIGFIAAAIIVGFQSEQLARVNSLLRDSSDWSSVSMVPAWAWILLGLFYFFVSEFLVHQAKYIWDDIRDKQRDKTLPQNQQRAIASGQISRSAALVWMSIRWTLGLILGLLIGGFPLFVLLLLVSFHQVLYVLWAKPNGAGHSLRLLVTIAFNLTPRMLAAMLVVVGSNISLLTIAPLIFLMALIWFQSFGVMASYWKMEAIYKLQLAKTEANRNHAKEPLPETFLPSVRPQSLDFFYNGNRLQHAGFTAAVLLSSVTLYLQISLQSCWFNIPILDKTYGYCSANVVTYTELDWLAPVVFVLLLCGFLGLCVCIISLLKRFQKPIKDALKALKKFGEVPCLAITIAALMSLAFLHDNLIIFLVSMVTFSLFYILHYENLTYPEYIGEELRERLPIVVHLWAAFLVYPTTEIDLLKAISLTFGPLDKLKRVRSEIDDALSKLEKQS